MSFAPPFLRLLSGVLRAESSAPTKSLSSSPAQEAFTSALNNPSTRAPPVNRLVCRLSLLTSLNDRVYSVAMVPAHSPRCLRVMMLITPPIASEPYKEDMGPRITSTRSIMEMGGREICLPPSWPLVLTERPAETGRPSTKIGRAHLNSSH